MSTSESNPLEPSAGPAKSLEIPAPMYAVNHLLGLPLEIRHRIWWFIYLSVAHGANEISKWNARQDSEWSEAQYTCRQMYAEVQDLWPRMAIPLRQIPFKLKPHDITIPMLRNFQSLTLELPYDYGKTKFHTRPANLLKFLAPFLRRLRIYFVRERTGLAESDQAFWGSSQNCMLYHTASRARDLRIVRDGGIEDANDKALSNLGLPSFNQIALKEILKSVQLMSKLKTLVLDKLDMFLLSSAVMIRKPLLEELHITTSPQNMPHAYAYGAPADIVQCPTPPVLPQIRRLYLTANSLLDATRLAFWNVSTLQELTWVVPDQTSQGAFRCNWVLQTADLLTCISMKARNLRSLKICMAREIHPSCRYDNELMGSFHELRRLPQLKALEIHLRSDDPFLVHSVIENLPMSLERLYTTDALGGLDILVEAVVERYLCGSSLTSSFVGQLGFIGFEYSSDDTWMVMLKLNGRLLDRKRNLRGLLASMRGRCRPCLAEFRPYNSRLSHTSRCTIIRPKDTDPDQVSPLLPEDIGPNSEHEEDYGFNGVQEVDKELKRILELESAAKMEDLPPLIYITKEDVKPGQHWLST